MPQRRRRQLRRNLLVLLGSLVAHTGLFFLVVSEFHFYPTREEPQEAVQVEIVPTPAPPIPPPPVPPIVKPAVQPTPQPPAPPPTPQPTPPKSQPPTPQRAAPQPTATAPAAATPKPTPTPAPKPAPAPTPLAPAAPSPTPGPPKVVVQQSAVVKSQAPAAPSPKIVLHKDKDQGAPLAPAISIPGATFAPPTGPTPTAAAPSGGGGGGLPGGALPGFGGGLRGSALGCANAEALHFTAAEKARCAQQFGEGARDSPQMSAIDASRREELDHEAASAAAAQKYRDSTPAGSEARPVQGQPRLGHSPSE